MARPQVMEIGLIKHEVLDHVSGDIMTQFNDLLDIIGATSQSEIEKHVRYLKENHKPNTREKSSELVKIGSQKLIETI